MTTDTAAARLRGLQAEHSVMLRRFLLRYTYGDREAAEDLLQETMIRAWRNLESVPFETDRARRWMFTVARNAAIDKLRARSSHPYEVNLLEMTTPPPAEDTVETVVALESIRDAVNSLSEDHRTVLAELYWRGRTPGETAKLLGVPVGTVKSRAHYALRSLRHRMGSGSHE
ncbi:sigma-70 family RNA polymerase sigma factor [Actinoplanes sp. TBRC 11911]|uniref:sigma-70 family RNA polymerase sigma factor n=1 Tax=Actinoplanes sp. TBRC 11911 TaxID=2729386 RepID=UPI00145E2424|nr:sigma-70 family RNA polymerase sigma factor [Actinoplanes sp. TBRC 11911]NMO49663.1 sigma-70 family RNA polymerase sigma factor [Actinoplanes sp. TBRC 11911]